MYVCVNVHVWISAGRTVAKILRNIKIYNTHTTDREKKNVPVVTYPSRKSEKVVMSLAAVTVGVYVKRRRRRRREEGRRRNSNLVLPMLCWCGVCLSVCVSVSVYVRTARRLQAG
jgi:hypothetical protein